MLAVLKTFSNFNEKSENNNALQQSQEHDIQQTNLFCDEELSLAYNQFNQYLINNGYMKKDIDNIYSSKKGISYISVRKCRKLCPEQKLALISPKCMGNIRLEKRKIFGHKIIDTININGKQYNVYEDIYGYTIGFLIGYIPVMKDMNLYVLGLYKKKKSLYDYLFYIIFMFIITNMVIGFIM